MTLWVSGCAPLVGLDDDYRSRSAADAAGGSKDAGANEAGAETVEAGPVSGDADTGATSPGGLEGPSRADVLGGLGGVSVETDSGATLGPAPDATLTPVEGHLVALNWGGAREMYSGGNGVIYMINPEGEFFWYRHDGYLDGSPRWAFEATRQQIGVGWNSFEQTFSGGGGAIYTIPPTGELNWYHHDGVNDGTFTWMIEPGVSGANAAPRQVATGWADYKQVLPGGQGVIYAVTPSGDLLWFRHDGASDGSPTWAPGSGTAIARGWTYPQVLGGQRGVLYAITESGELLWFRHDGFLDGTIAWADAAPRTVGVGWSGFERVFSAEDGVLYAVTPTGELRWFRHDGVNDGGATWAP